MMMIMRLSLHLILFNELIQMPLKKITLTLVSTIVFQNRENYKNSENLLRLARLVRYIDESSTWKGVRILCMGVFSIILHVETRAFYRFTRAYMCKFKVGKYNSTLGVSTASKSRENLWKNTCVLKCDLKKMRYLNKTI